MPSNSPAPTAESLIEPLAEAFLLDLLDTPGPSGFEDVAARAWRQYAEPFAAVREDAVGNSYATVGKPGGTRVALAGHIDEIGLIVTKVDDKGFLRCTNIGGWDTAVLVGQRVRVLGEDGPVAGCVGRTGIHALEGDARTKLPKLKDLWLDIGAADGDDARARVSVGDPVVIDCAPVRMGEHRLMSRAIDNRVGAFVAVEVARACAEREVGAEVTAVATTAEETGAAGALTATYGLQPDCAVAIDVTWPSDTPAGFVSGDFALGEGVVITRGATTSVEVTEQLIEAAERAEVPYQLRGMGIRTKTDADAIARAGAGVPVAVVSVPARYLHTPCEQVDLRDVRSAIELLTAWIESL